jgi:hypothetical protein
MYHVCETEEPAKRARYPIRIRSDFRRSFIKSTVVRAATNFAPFISLQTRQVSSYGATAPIITNTRQDEVNLGSLLDTTQLDGDVRTRRFRQP